MLGSLLIGAGALVFTVGAVGEYKNRPVSLKRRGKAFKELFGELGLLDTKKGQWMKCVYYDNKPNYTQIGFKLSDNLCSVEFIKHSDKIKEKLNKSNLEVFFKGGLMHMRTINPNMQRLPYEYKPTKESIIPIGVDIMDSIVHWDLTIDAHLLICASNGAGKSRLINVMINHILLNNKDAMLYLCDLKRGLEFGLFENLACVKNYCEVLADVEKLIADFEAEGERRYKIMKDRGYRDYNDYIKDFNDLPRAFLIIDEFADITRAGDKDITTKIVELGAKLRAVACHIVVLTQRPTADFISPSLKANMGVIGMRAKNTHNSNLIIESDKLVGLEKGQGISLLNNDEVFFRAFEFDSSIVEQTISKLPKKRKKQKKEQELIK